MNENDISNIFLESTQTGRHISLRGTLKQSKDDHQHNVLFIHLFYIV